MRRLVTILFIVLISTFPVYASSVHGKSGSPAYTAYLRGLMAERYGNPEEALELFVKAKNIDKESDALNLKTAVQYIKLGDNQKAIDILAELSETSAINVDAYLLLILMHSTEGRESTATEVYGELLERLYEADISNIKIAESLAQLRLQKMDYNGAIGIYQNILKEQPNYEDGLFWLGYLYEEKNRRKEAIEVWKKLIKLNPDHSDALNSLGYIYAEEGIHLNEAEQMVLKALKSHPDSPAYLDSLGWIYFKQGRLNDAAKYIQKAVEGFQDAIIYDHLGEVFYKLGDIEKALEQWKRALILAPDKNYIKLKLRKTENEYPSRKD